jgi:hypothetical protein
MTPSCEVVSLPELAQVSPLSNQNTLFITNELLPLLASLFPKSANQLNSNAVGHALGYGFMLKGFMPNQIRAVVIELAEREPDRYAPIPQELKQLCVGRFHANRPAVEQKNRFIASMSSIEMQVCVGVLTGGVRRNRRDIERAISKKISAIVGMGGVVDGERGFLPLVSIISSSPDG